MSDDKAPPITRRFVLKALAAATVCPLATACEFVDVHDIDEEQAATDSPFSIDDPDLEALSDVGGTACFSHGSQDLLLVRASSDEILAYDRICPHAGAGLGDCDGNFAPASWDADSQTLTCNHHGSEFGPEGQIRSGPTVEEIRTFPVEFDPETGEGAVLSS